MKKFLKSFINAGNGILLTIRQERNMKIHVLSAVFVLIYAYYRHIDLWEWAVLLLTITMVLVTEMLNSALELTIDIYQKSYHPLAKAAKDIAAGAVLITAVMAVFVGLIIFYF
jgi:diacylglycerol kinase (ATP)